MSKWILGFVLLLALPLAAYAQDDESPIRSCNRAWLASDWPTVAADCAIYAEDQEVDSIKWVAKASYAPNATLAADATGFGGSDSYLAGKARARVAFAYGKLKRAGMALSEQDKAAADLQRAKQYLNSQAEQQNATDLLALVNRNDFFKTAGDSDLLATI